MGARADARAPEVLLGQLEPAAAADHDRRLAVVTAADLLAGEPAVPDLDDAVGDRRNLRIVADEDRRRPVLTRQLDDEREQPLGRGRVELAGRLVGEKEPWPVREGCADGDPLLLASRELRWPRVAPREEADALQQLVGALQLPLAPDATEAEREGDRLADARRGPERPFVVLVGVAEQLRPVAVEPARAQLRELEAEDVHRARRRPLEAGENTQQRRLARAARAQHGEHLALADRHRQALQCGCVAFGRRVDAKEVARQHGGSRIAPR